MAIYCTELSEIPSGDHWAIIGTASEMVRGYDLNDPDERKTFLNYVAYLDEKEWLEAINKFVARNDMPKYRVLKVTVPTVDVKVTVSVK
jgi:hypothetical protein